MSGALGPGCTLIENHTGQPEHIYNGPECLFIGGPIKATHEENGAAESRAEFLNPLTADKVRDFARTLQTFLAVLDREVVHAAIVGEREGDLLCPEGEEVNRFSKFLDGRVRVPLESLGFRSRSLALLDAFKNELLSAEHKCSPLSIGPDARIISDSHVSTVAENASTDSGAGAASGVPGDAPDASIRVGVDDGVES